MQAVFIYALKDPFTGLIRYIGKAENPEKRLRSHIIAARIEKNHRAYWIRSLSVRGVRPELEMLAQVPESEWQQWEVDYIAAFRLLGCQLVNGTDGGEGGTGHLHCRETLIKLSELKKGKKPHPNFTMRGKKHSQNARLKMRAARKANPSLQEFKPGHPSWNKGTLGVKQSPETCAKKSLAHVGKKQSPETIAKRVATQKSNRENLWPN